jgi:MFS family permease
MDQSRTTGVSLQELNRTGLEERPRHHETSTTEPDIMEQSLLADSQVPDGGEAWVVISGCAVVTWWFIGTSYCWGILQAALVKEGVSSSSTLAFVGSLATACISFLGILNARVIRKLGTRYSAMLGIFFLGLGEVLSGFSAMSIGGLFATAGVVMGIGIRYESTYSLKYCFTLLIVSLCFMVVSITPAQYFRAKRGIANGIVYAAGGLGGAVISFVMNALLDRVGVQWTFRTIGFMTWATGLPAAYLIKQRVPIPPSAVVDWYVVSFSSV